jgi:hypothetical protein
MNKNQLSRLRAHPFFAHVFERFMSVRVGLNLGLVSATWKKQYWSFRTQNKQTYNIDTVVFGVHVFVQR